LKVVAAHLDRVALGRQLTTDGLEVSDQLALLGVDRDRGLARVKRCLDRPVDVAKLGIAVGMGGLLAGLRVGLRL